MQELSPIRETWRLDRSDGSLLVERIQDCTPFLDRAREISASGEWRGDDNDFWHAASIPNMVIEQWLQRGINVFREEDWPKVRELLNGEFAYLKCMPKRL